MKKFVFCLIFLYCATTSHGFGKDAQGCGKDCISCHRISKDEVVSTIKELDPTITVEDISQAQVRGLYQILVRKDGKPRVLYMDYSKNYIILGSILDVRNKRDVTRQSIEDNFVVDISKINLKNALVMGNKSGEKKVYVFSDPECPFCLKLHEELELLVKEDPSLKVYIILFALPMHPNAGWKTNSIICESKKSMKEALRMLERSYKNEDVKKVDCGTNYEERNRILAKSLDIGATPAVVLGNGKVIMGYRKKDELKKLIE